MNVFKKERIYAHMNAATETLAILVLVLMELHCHKMDIIVEVRKHIRYNLRRYVYTHSQKTGFASCAKVFRQFVAFSSKYPTLVENSCTLGSAERLVSPKWFPIV